MARFDPYIDADYYEAHVMKGRVLPDADAATLVEDIAIAQAIVDRELGVVDGGFNEDDSGVYVVDAIGGRTLWLREAPGRAFFVRSIATDGIGVDSERDGTFDGYAFDLGDSWCRGIEYYRTAAEEVSYCALELLPRSFALIEAWPDGPATVQITGNMGIEGGPPAPIKAVMVSVTRDVREHFSGGPAGMTHSADEDIPLSDQTWRQIARAKQLFSRRMPF